MTPRQRIAELYWRYPQPRCFDTDIYLHRISGYVIDRPGVFLMGRPVDKDDLEEHILDPAIKYGLFNAWFIWAFSGPIHMMFELAPFPLPYVGWIRRNRGIRWYECERALQMVGRVVTFA